MGGGAAAGYAWKAGDKVAAYLDDQDQPDLAAEIRGAHQCMVDLLGLEAGASFRFIDLGAGAGAVAASVMRHFPNARGILADISAPMMEAGGQKLTPFEGRYHYVEYDMNSDAWPSELQGPFQAIVSARAIHHLTDPLKGRIFRRAYEALAPGGVFVNWDLFRQPDQAQNPNHPTATIQDQLDLMSQAGFQAVAPYHEVGRRLVFFGQKPA